MYFNAFCCSCSRGRPLLVQWTLIPDVSFHIPMYFNALLLFEGTTLTCSMNPCSCRVSPYSFIFHWVVLLLFEGTTLTCSMNSYSWRVLPYSYVFLCVLSLSFEGTTLTCSINSYSWRVFLYSYVLSCVLLLLLFEGTTLYLFNFIRIPYVRIQ